MTYRLSKLICILSFLFLPVSLWAQPDLSSEDSSAKFAPLAGAVYLTGLGGIYGAGVGGNNLLHKDTQVLVGIAGGALEGYGLLVNQFPVGTPRLRASFGFANIERVEFETSYARGLNENLVFRQQLKSRASFFGLQYELLKSRLFLQGRFAYTWTHFVQFKTQSGSAIPFRMNDLHDIENTSPSLGFLFHILQESERKKLALKAERISFNGRLAQSDMDVYRFKLNGLFPIAGKWSLATTTQYQASSITKEAAPGGPNGNCGSIGDVDINRQCTQLQSDFREFITASNRYGTALPIGGSTGLRSFREFRFRAANTGIAGVELRRDFHWIRDMQFASFFEMGWASDQTSDFFTRSVQSYGVGLRSFIGKIPVRFEVASGSDGEAAFFTVGYPW